jgi:tetratricopeptide (TPR) repeat protein
MPSHKSILFTLLLLLTGTIQINAQNWFQEFAALLQKKDDAGQRKLLKKWEKADKNDPELYVAYSNYYYEKAKTTTTGIYNYKIPGQTELYKDSTKPNVHMYAINTYDTALIAKGISYLDQGIAIAPNRLDLRFGKVYTLGEVKKYDEFTTEIVKTIQHSIAIQHQWLWSFNKPLKDPEKVVFNAGERYFTQLANLQDEKQYDNMLKLVNARLELTPNNPVVLTTYSSINYLKKNYTEAVKGLLKAEQLDPNDVIILLGLARNYTALNDKANAIKYYQKVTTLGNKDEVEFAKEQIDELSK